MDAVMINLDMNESFMKISEMVFQRYTLLNNDKTLKVLLDHYEKEPNKTIIKYVISFKDHSWNFLEGDYPDNIIYISKKFNQKLRYPN